MKALREEQVAVALRYLQALNAGRIFERYVCRTSEEIRQIWATAWDCKELKEIMERLENDGSFPYYVTYEKTSFGECYSILTVSPYYEDFELAFPKYDASSETWRVYAYVYNKSCPAHSEMSSILVKNKYGILYRVA